MVLATVRTRCPDQGGSQVGPRATGGVEPTAGWTLHGVGCASLAPVAAGEACDDLRILRARLYLVIGMVKRPEMTRFCWLRPLTNRGARVRIDRANGAQVRSIATSAEPSEALRLLV